jgi:hypothetical protein
MEAAAPNDIDHAFLAEFPHVSTKLGIIAKIGIYQNVPAGFRKLSF